MNWNTPVSISESPLLLPESQIWLSGSCFSGHIGKKLSEAKFNTIRNLFGTTYDPLSVFRQFRVSPGEILEKSFEREGVHLSLHTHSNIFDYSARDFENRISKLCEERDRFLQESKVLILTFGTAYFFSHEGKAVQNCQKLPTDAFQKHLLTPEDILKAYAETEAVTESKKVILTLSPVRHLREGLPENTVSKSILRYAAHLLTERYDNISYFPAYEILMDELRDYRFYNDDMLHPSGQAVSYIWKRFRETYFTESAENLFREAEKLRKSLNHKPLFPESISAQKFYHSLNRKLDNFETAYPNADISEERTYVQNKLRVYE